MPGGIIFECDGLRLLDSVGVQLTCRRCGGDRFDIRVGGAYGDTVECSAADCGQPVTVPAGAEIRGAGR